MIDYYAEEIKMQVKMPDVISFYGFDERKNRIPCPFHNGEDRNLSYKSDFFKCFVCGEKGDVIAFVQKYFRISFFDTVKKLNEDFKIGMPIGQPLTLRKKREIEGSHRERQRLIQQKKEEKMLLEMEWEAALQEYKKYEEQKRIFAPESINEEPHPLFLEAIKNIEYCKYLLDEAEKRLINHDKGY